MRQIRNFEEANQALLNFVPPFRNTQRYTLERMTALMEHLGNPQNQLKVIHIAGTSGKSSTAYYISAMLQSGGYKVGLTVSPHIDEVNERVQINNYPLAEVTFCQELRKFLDLIRGFGNKPTYFEVLIAFAYWEFARQSVDYAVIEVGLGGLLDGTNVAKRSDKICVITDIGLDHTDVLGQTIKEITAQKAGIIYPYNSVFSYLQSEPIMKVLREVCEQNRAELHEVIPPRSYQVPKQLPLFQRRNWYLASKVAQYTLKINGRQELDRNKLQSSSNTLIPARMEIFKIANKTVIIDGSHNEQKIRALIRSIRHKYPDQPMAVLVSFGQNKVKSLQASLRFITKESRHITVTAFKLGQDEVRKPVNPRKIAGICRRMDFNEVSITANPAAAFKQLLKRPERLLLVTGSFYLLNHIRPPLLSK